MFCQRIDFILLRFLSHKFDFLYHRQCGSGTDGFFPHEVLLANCNEIETVMYCQDGLERVCQKELESSVELKSLVRFCRWCIDEEHIPVKVIGISFSFYDVDAASKLDVADVFYFKGFGGGVERLVNIF